MNREPPPFFVRGPSPLARLVFFGVLALTCMVLDAHFKALPLVRKSISVVTYPIQQIALAPSRAVERVGGFFVSQQRLQADNAAVRLQLLQQAEQLQRFSSLEAEVDTLRRLLGARERAREKTLLVELIQANRNPFSRKIQVDKGATDGVQAGQAVIDASGVVGQITEVLPFAAQVTLITEKSHPVPVMVRRNGLRAVLFGSGRADELELPFIPINADIQNGDTLVTSGIDGTFPAGIPVATVTNIERNAANVFAQITCTPLAGVASNKHLLVLGGSSNKTMRPSTSLSMPSESKLEAKRKSKLPRSKRP